MQTEALKQLLEQNFNANVQLLKRAGSVLRAARDGASRPGGLRSADTRTLLSDLVSLNVAYYSQLSEQSLRYLNAVVALAENALGTPAPGATPGTTAAAPEQSGGIALAGKRGETVTGEFRLDNGNDAPLVIAFETLEFSSDAGDRVNPAALRLEPAEATLAPHTTATFDASVVLDEAFKAGQTYRSAIRVVGFPGRQIPVSVTVAEG